MKAAAKQNCYFFCQLWYQRQAATDHGSLSSFHISHKSLLHWSSHKYWPWSRNALQYVLLKSASQSWTPLGRQEQRAGEVWRAGTRALPATWAHFPSQRIMQKGQVRNPQLWQHSLPFFSCTGLRCLQWLQSTGPRIPAPSWFKMFWHLSKWLIIFLIRGPLLHTIHCNVNFSHLCTSLRTDSDLKAALVCPGPASIIGDMCQVRATNTLYRQFMPNSTPEVQMENGEKRIFYLEWLRQTLFPFKFYIL